MPGDPSEVAVIHSTTLEQRHTKVINTFNVILRAQPSLDSDEARSLLAQWVGQNHRLTSDMLTTVKELESENAKLRERLEFYQNR